MGETNNEEEEVDQLLDDDPSGTVDLSGDDVVISDAAPAQEEEEPEDDAQIRMALEHPGAGRDTEEDEDEDEEDSDDDLAKMQKAAREPKPKLRPNPKSGASSTTSRHYKPSPQTQINPPSAPRGARRTADPNPLLGNGSPARPTSEFSRPAPMASPDETFPSAGTLARAERARPDRKARNASYEPPEGTRASAHKAKLGS
jgi:hypothetical protein